jgi:hypothetical protein
MMAALMAALKSHLRITANDLDGQLDMYLRAAVDSAEQFTGIVLVKSGMELEEDFAKLLRLPLPLMSVEGVSVDGEELSSDDYTVTGGKLVFSEGVSGSVVQVSCTAGRTHMEEDILAAIMLRAAKLFNNPADSAEMLISASDNLLTPYRQIRR